MGFIWALWQATKVCVCIFVGAPVAVAMFVGLFMIPCAAMVVSAWWLLLFLAYPLLGTLLYGIVLLLDTVGDYW